MISWIQRTFQQHFKWLFLLLLATVIISFVFITNASSGFGHTAKQVPARPFFGVNLASEEEQKALVRDASLSVQLHNLPIRSNAQFEQYVYQRHAALHLAGELNLPAPSQADLIAHIQTLPIFSSNGKFDAQAYAKFVDDLKTNPQVKEADVFRVIADDVTYQQVLKHLSGPGYVLPAEVQTQLNRADSLWTLEAVTIDSKSFKPAIPVTDEALSKYFEYNGPRYVIAPKTGVSVIHFPASAYAGQIVADDITLRAYYDANAGRFTKPAATSAKPSTPDSDFAAVRLQVLAAYTAERTQALAAAAASDFAVALSDARVSAAGLDSFLASNKLTRKQLAPFNADSVPVELGGNPAAAVEAGKTGPDRLYSDPVATGQGSAILVWNETVPSRQPALAEVKAAVTADFIESEKRRLFAEAGRTLRTALETRLKAGDTFAKAVEASANVIPAKLGTKSWPAFTLSKPPQDIDNDYSLYTALVSLQQKGDLTPMVSSADQGVIVYAADKKLPPADTTSASFIDTRNRLAAYTASHNASTLLAAIVKTELDKSAPAEEIR